MGLADFFNKDVGAEQGASRLLEEQAELQKKLLDVEVDRLSKSEKGTDKLRGRLLEVNAALDEQAKQSKRAEAAAKDAEETYKSSAIGQLTAGVKEFGSQAGAAFSHAASMITSVVTAAGHVDLGGSMKSVRGFEDSVDALGVMSGRKSQEIQQQFNDVGKSINEKPEDVAKWSQSIAGLTYSAEGATKGLKGMAQYAADTGQSIDQVLPLQVALQRTGGVAGDTSQAIGMIHAQAEKLGTVGGVRALGDQVTGLNNVMSLASVKSEKDLASFVSLAGGLGKGLAPEAAQRVQQRVLGDITSDTEGWSRYLGHKIQLDDQGHVADLKGTSREIQEKWKTRNPKDADRLARQYFGAEAGTAFLHADLSEDATATAASDRPTRALEQLSQTAGGQRKGTEITKSINLQPLVGSEGGISRTSDEYAAMVAKNPVLGLLDQELGDNKIYGTARKAFIAASAVEKHLGVSDWWSGTSRGGTAGGNQLRGGQPGETSDLAKEMNNDFAATHGADGRPIGGGARPTVSPSQLEPQGQQPGGASADVLADLAAAIRDLKDLKVSTTIVNSTGGPIEAVDNASAANPAQQ